MYQKSQSYDVQFLRYGVRQTEFFVILGHFLLFQPLWQPRKSKFWKTEKITWKYYHFAHVYHKWQSYDKWFLRHEAWWVGRSFCHFELFFCHFTPLTTRKIKILKKLKSGWRYYQFTHVYHTWQSNNVWFLRYWVWQTDFFLILDHFLPFWPPNNPKYQNFEKIKKTPGNIIILQMCTLNDNHMMYGFWDMECDRQNFFSFWAVFFPFYPSNNPKYQNFEKMKKHSGDITILHMCTLDMKSDGQNFLSFWTIFAYLSP